MILTLYEMWFYDVLGGAGLPSNLYVHEIALVLTYISVGLMLALVWKFILVFLGRFIQ